MFARAKADDQMVSLVGLGPGVARLRGQHFARSGVWRGAAAIRDGHPAEPFLLVLRIAQVPDQAGEVAYFNRLHRHMFGDHDAEIASQVTNDSIKTSHAPTELPSLPIPCPGPNGRMSCTSGTAT